MSNQRGLIPPAVVTTTIVLVLCAILWGAFGVASLTEPDSLSIAAHRYLCILLATVTICSMIVNMTARALGVILAAVVGERVGEDYATGYADGISAQPTPPGVTRLVPLRR